MADLSHASNEVNDCCFRRTFSASKNSESTFIFIDTVVNYQFVSVSLNGNDKVWITIVSMIPHYLLWEPLISTPKISKLLVAS